MADVSSMLWRAADLALVPSVCVCLVIYLVLSRCSLGGWRKQAEAWTHLLVITAHPDDECMFFAPTILDFIRRQRHVSLLCLSTGNYMRLGVKRKKELIKSCDVLGISEDDVKIVDDTCFPDDPCRIWNEELVARVILQHLEKVKPDVVLTFDGYGITGHNNHRSIYYGCRKFLQEGRAPNGISFFSIESTNVLRKYISFLDVPLSTFLSSKFYISPLSYFINAHRAMYAHWSQMTWFRVLYMMFSRYMLINTLVDLVPLTEMPR